MMSFITPSILFLLTFGLGFWLSLSGKPYNGFLFNFHKLIALGLVVVSGIQLSRWLKIIDSSAVITGLLILGVIAVVALFASGALLSAGKWSYPLMLTIHRLGSFTAVIVLLFLVYQLWK